MEKIPSQLLSRVRADSFATISPLTKGLLLRFSGYDGYPYAVQSSSDLINWTSVSTNLPSDGFFKFISATTADEPQFYRSKLLP